MTVISSLRRLRHGRLSPLGLLWTGLGSAYRAALAVSPFPTAVTMPIGPYGPFRLDGRFAFSNFENWGSGRNVGFQACIELCAGATCVLDVGAHIGLISLPASRVLAKDGMVFAFEPAKINRELLERHVLLNGARNIEVIEDLVGDTDSENVPFYEQRTDSGLNSVTPAGGRSGFVKTTKRQRALDSFCKSRGIRPDVIKIDVEGAEIGVLRGARDTISQCRPVLVLSVHPNQIAQLGHDADELGNLLDEFGYECRTADGQASPPREPTEYIVRPRPGA